MGTFDISILDLGGGVIEVLSTNGDVTLGGDNLDERIVDYVAEEFAKEHGIDLRKDNMALQRIKEAAEKVKIELSSNTQSEINLPYITAIDNMPKHLVLTLSRAQFERLIEADLNRLSEPCVKAIKDSGLSKENIDEVILVGGSTRIPAVERIVENIFGKKPSKALNVDECVSVGACIMGSVLSGENTDVLLLDVVPMSLSIETYGGISTVLIEKNTTIPTSKSNVFSTAADNQPSVQINVLQGNRSLAKDNKSLGQFTLDGIPPAPKGVPQIEVEFSIDANGILSVKAHDKGTGKQQSITISGSSNIDKDEIERMKREAEENAEADRQAVEEIETLNLADSTIFSSHKQIKEFGDKMVGDEKDQLNSKIEELKTAKDSRNIKDIRKIIDELNNIWNKISTRIYQQGKDSEPSAATEEQPKSNNAQDTEFEEVK